MLKILMKALMVVSSNRTFPFSKSGNDSRQCRFDIQILTKLFKHRLHVLVILVASRRVLEHGLGDSGVGCHDTLVEIALTLLESVEAGCWRSTPEPAPSVTTSRWHLYIFLVGHPSAVLVAWLRSP